MTDSTELTTFCDVHPDRETALRCNKCNRYMCAQCAVQTPVGYRCRECVRQHEDRFFTANNRDDLIVAGVCAGLSALIGGIFGYVAGGFFIFALVLGFPAGGIIAEAALRATARRRSRYSPIVGAVATFVGGLVGIFIPTYLSYMALYNEIVQQAGEEVASQAFPPLGPEMIFGMLTGNLGPLIFAGMMAIAVYGRYKMRS